MFSWRAKIVQIMRKGAKVGSLFTRAHRYKQVSTALFGRLLMEAVSLPTQLKMTMKVDQIFQYFPDLTDLQRSQFEQLDALYREWNAKINVISRKDIDNLYSHHVLHSLGIAKVISFRPGTRVMDIGTGGGFPGIPLAILFPECRFKLVDSIGKLLQARGFNITIQKFDPYINIDPGTLNPYEHGECYVTDDGQETDLDLGHYERFTGIQTTRFNNFTTGRIYQSVIDKERRSNPYL